jgi:chlorobactene glucosyltransferase
LLFGLAITHWIHSFFSRDIIVTPDAELRSSQPANISVIVPARNEARNIRRCVEGLLAQDYPSFEVIVVDDRSTDATPRILAEISARDPRLRVVQGTDLPPGWAGKPHALSLGVEVATGEWLCFIDADTFAAPQLLRSTFTSALAHQADLFSILTAQELGSFWEKVILPVVFTALSVGFPARRVNDPGTPDAIANGQFILIRRTVYDQVGGHRAVRDQIAEDKALAERVKGSGYRLIVADGRQVANTRMYTSLPEIWEGWTKNIFLGMRGRLGLLLAGAFTGLLGALALPVWLVAALAWLAVSSGLVPVVVLAQCLIVWIYLLAHRALAARAFGISPLYALTLPLGALLFTAMMFASAFKVLSGQGVTWKGRTYIR